MEFKYLSEVVLPQAPAFNYDDLKAELEQKCNEYENLVYTEEQIKEAKEDKAKLNKLKAALNNERIQRQKEWNAPFAEFKSKVDDLISIIDKPVAMIDKQVKEYDKQQEDAKREKIREVWDNLDGKPDWLKPDDCFSNGWLLKSCSMSKVKACMEEIIATSNRDIATLERLPEYSFEAVVAYKKNRKLDEAITEATKLTNLRKMKEAQEEGRRKKAAEETTQKQAEQTVKDSTEPAPVAQTVEENATVYHMVFECDINISQALKLRAFCDSIEVELKKVN
nr:MAG TPA: Protein of unknown function (DUF1351) [Caudoviricetes sp.]